MIMLTAEMRNDLKDKIYASHAQVSAKVDRALMAVLVLAFVIEGVLLGGVAIQEPLGVAGLNLSVQSSRLNALLAAVLAGCGVGLFAALEQRERRSAELVRQYARLTGAKTEDEDSEVAADIDRALACIFTLDWMTTMGTRSLVPNARSSPLPAKTAVLYGLLTALWAIPLVVPLHTAAAILAEGQARLWAILPLIAGLAYGLFFVAWYQAMRPNRRVGIQTASS